MPKKIDTVKVTYRIPKDIYDLLQREKTLKRKTENRLINEALEEYLSPHVKVTHERDSKTQLNSVIGYEKLCDVKQDIIISLLEENLRALYFNTLAIPTERQESQLLRQHEGMENVFKRIELSIEGKSTNNILNRFLKNGLDSDN